ncbi:MAG: ROK family protein [Rhodospirillaceae bacterium]|nr:MAG: ROK family protein [Rhodospirillaceae bacterium]
MTTQTDIRIGIDLGGTKIEAVGLDRDGKERFRKRVATPHGSYDGTVKAVADLVAATAAATATSPAAGSASVGIGIPGAASLQTGLIKNANSVVLIGHPFQRDMEAAVGAPVRLANDADCFALSEASDGSAAGADVVFGVIIGTGVGGGLVVHGRVIHGANAITGEWGHNPMPRPHDDERPGPACYCGRSGCVETFLSGPGLSRDDAARRGTALPAAEIVARAETGEPIAAESLARYVERLARATAVVINIVDPHVIVLGGGLSQIARLYRDVPALWPRYVFSDTVTTRLLPPRHGDASGVRGAAWLWP